VIIHFTYIGGICDDHCLNVVFLTTQTSYMHTHTLFM